ncbi:MAG: glycosyltransferase family 4 protein [bacterium]
MKVYLVSDNLIGFHKYWSGAEMVCDILAESLKEEGEELLFFTTKFGKNASDKKIYQIPVLIAGQNFLKKFLMPFSFFWGALYSFFYLWRNKPDIINLLHSNHLFVPVMLASRVLRIPSVFTFLDYYMICSRATFRLASGKICREKEGKVCLRCISRLKFLERLLIRQFAKSLKGVITFTETSKLRLIEHGFPADKIRVIYTYTIPEKFSQVSQGQAVKDTILVVASFHEHKGLQVVLEALPYVLPKVPRAKLRVIGQGNETDKKRIEDLVEKLAIQGSVEFLGQKGNDEVLEIMRENEVVVIPEQWPSEFGPLALVEAMALGRPVVASRIGSAPDFVKEGVNGFLAEYNNPEEFAEKIVWLLENKTKAQEMGERAKKAGSILFRYDQGKKTIAFYKQLLK